MSILYHINILYFKLYTLVTLEVAGLFLQKAEANEVKKHFSKSTEKTVKMRGISLNKH